MRRGKGKLSTFNWMLVLFAGIFQILTFVFDQIVIQYEENYRKTNFEILSKSESRSSYLRMNNRVNDFLLASENEIFILSSSNFSNEKKKSYYFSNIVDQNRLIETIIEDKMVISGLEDRYYEFRDLINDNNLLIKEFENNFSNLQLDTVGLFLQNNNINLQSLLDIMAELGMNSSKDLNKLLIYASIIENQKQLMLLLGVVFQLLSLLSLLILFRRLLMSKF